MLSLFKRLAAPLLSIMLLSGSISANNQSTAAIQESLVGNATQFIKNNPGLSASLFILLLMELRIQTRDADRLPTRCDLSRLKSSDVSWKDIWNVIDDGLIGQIYKSESLKANEEGKIIPSALKPPKGVLGHIHSYWVPVIQAMGVTYFIYELSNLIALNDSKKIKEAFEAKTATFSAAFLTMFLTGKYCSAVK